LEQTLVVIRERDLAGLFDLALVVSRRRFWVLAVAGLVGIAPFFALNAWLFSMNETEPGLAFVLWMVEAPFATAPLTLVMGDLMFGRKPTARRVLTALWRSTIVLFLVHGFLRVVCFFWIPTRLAFANEVILLERDRWWRILARGRELCGDRGGEVATVGLVQIIVTFVFAYLFHQWTLLILGLFLGTEVIWDLPELAAFGGWEFQLPTWLATAFFAVLRFLLYIDQRIRLEGWAVKLRLREVGRALEESRRW
jgi:hypothetical protein